MNALRPYFRCVAAVFAFALTAAGCGAATDETLHCRDLLPPQEAGYSALAAVVTSAGSAGCSACHNTETPLHGYNFEGPGVAYDALSSKIELIYAQVAAGTMPQDGAPWGEPELRLLRSWYCYGGVYEE